LIKQNHVQSLKELVRHGLVRTRATSILELNRRRKGFKASSAGCRRDVSADLRRGCLDREREPDIALGRGF
jgi:hypothetical protein